MVPFLSLLYEASALIELTEVVLEVVVAVAWSVEQLLGGGGDDSDGPPGGEPPELDSLLELPFFRLESSFCC